MAKNKTKQAKIKEVSFEIEKAKFKKLLSNLLTHAATYDASTLLSGIKIHLANNTLEMAATDGNTLLKGIITLEEATGREFDAVLSGIHLSKMKLAKSYEFNKKKYSSIDVLDITLKESETLITDRLNKITYTIPYICGQYPKYNQLFAEYDEKKYIKIGINPKLLARLVDLPDGNKSLVMVVNKNDPTRQITFYTDENNEAQYTAAVMPVILRDNYKDKEEYLKAKYGGKQ